MTRPRPGFSAAQSWPRLMADSSLLMADAGTVMMLRAWRMMAGGTAAAREAERMLSEKVEAGFELAGAFAAGKVATPEAAARKAISVYSRRVKANRERLS